MPDHYPGETGANFSGGSWELVKILCIVDTEGYGPDFKFKFFTIEHFFLVEILLRQKVYWPFVFVAASAIFWKVSKKEPSARIVFLKKFNVSKISDAKDDQKKQTTSFVYASKVKRKIGRYLNKTFLLIFMKIIVLLLFVVLYQIHRHCLKLQRQLS